MSTVLKIIGGLVVIMAVGMVVKNNKTPNNLGVNNSELAPMPSSPNAVSTQTDDEDKKVEPFEFKGDLENSKKVIIDVLDKIDKVKIVKNEEDYIYSVFETKTMKYKDDVEFYFDKENKLIHFRSASRIGYSDMGLNKERYEKIRKMYYEQ